MKNPSRRTFLKMVGVGGAALTAAAVGCPSIASEGMKIDNDNVAMLYDATRCVGCKACMTTCKRVNLDSGSLAYEQAEFDPDGLWDAPADLSGDTRTLIKLHKESPTKWSYVKHSCMHCQKPSCVSVCPVSAMTRDPESGIVSYDKGICIGCRYCQIACAFNIPRFQWDKALPQIVKCDMCKSTELPRTGTTGCARVCPVDAIHFGKRGDLLSEAQRRLDARAVIGMDARQRPFVIKVRSGRQAVQLDRPFRRAELPRRQIDLPASRICRRHCHVQLLGNPLALNQLITK